MIIKKLVVLSALLQCMSWFVAGPQPGEKLRIGYSSISSRQAQLWIAKDEGIFRKYV